MPAPSATDLIDRVDDEDRPVGTVRRGDVPAAGANFRTVHVFAFDTAGLLLLQRTGPAHRHPGRLGSSAAGFLHAGEGYKSAARRRLAEEVDVRTALREVGRTSMREDGATKFVRLFWTSLGAAMPHIVDPGHVGALEFRHISDVEQRLADKPDAFTQTFPHVFRLLVSGQG